MSTFSKADLKQKYPDSCAIKCQELILRDYGIYVNEDELIEIARKHGWFKAGVGVYMRHNGLLLAGFGIEYNHSQGNTLDAISKELSLSHRIMVNVNSQKLLLETPIKLHEEACHAVLVTGIENENVIIIDPKDGNPNKRISSDKFLVAWMDSDCYMLTTNIAPTIYQSKTT